MPGSYLEDRFVCAVVDGEVDFTTGILMAPMMPLPPMFNNSL